METPKEGPPSAGLAKPKSTRSSPAPSTSSLPAVARTSLDKPRPLTATNTSKDSPSADSSQELRKQASRRNMTTSVPASRSTSPAPSQTNSPVRPGNLTGEQKQSAGGSGLLSAAENGRVKRTEDNQSLAARPTHTMSQTNSTQSLPTNNTVHRNSSAASVPLLQPPGASETSTPRQQGRTLIPTPSSGGVSASASETNSPMTASFTPRSRMSPPVSAGPASAAHSRRNSLQRKPDPLQLVAPTVTLQTSTPPMSAEPHSANNSANENDQQLPPPTSKAHSRGPSGPKSTLETVIEGTPPTASALTKALERSISSDRIQKSATERSAAPTKSPNNEEVLQDRSESEGNLSDRRRRKQEPAPLGSLKARPGPPSRIAPPPTPRMKQAETARNMTVETETVSSIPHSALNPDKGVTRQDTGGSVRLESSYETIRPRKDRKRPTRKAPSIHNGTASSKADIFEARVASVVDEANSDDSDETFVYESNPPDAAHQRPSRHHSRTPSSASIASMNDRRHYGNMGTQHRVSGKRSMKFSNNPYSNDSPPDGETGSIRAHQPRHISRFGRTMGSHTSLHGPDSPFTQANKIRVNVANPGHLTPGTPKGPKTAPLPRGRGPSAQWVTNKNDLYRQDFEGVGDSDDENLPLLGTGTVRTPRSSRYTRRTGGRRSLERIYSYQQQQHSSRFSRQSGCWIFSFAILLLVLLGASGLSVISNKSLYDVRVDRIENVLASEQELMLDLLVRAVNPNFVDVQITDMDINVFAKSSYVNKNETKGPRDKRALVRTSDRKASRPGTPWQDPDGRWGDDDHDDLEGDTQTMLLGRVFQFDQSLHFGGSPFRRKERSSMGELRLAEPGNRTESGGSERWQRVLGHPFQLILRGVLKYQVPVTGRGESSAVYGSVIVHPEDGFDAYGRMRLESVEEEEEDVTH